MAARLAVREDEASIAVEREHAVRQPGERRLEKFDALVEPALVVDGRELAMPALGDVGERQHDAGDLSSIVR
jgi:hypothetical protein